MRICSRICKAAPYLHISFVIFWIWESCIRTTTATLYLSRRKRITAKFAGPILTQTPDAGNAANARTITRANTIGVHRWMVAPVITRTVSMAAEEPVPTGSGISAIIRNPVRPLLRSMSVKLPLMPSAFSSSIGSTE